MALQKFFVGVQSDSLSAISGATMTLAEITFPPRP